MPQLAIHNPATGTLITHALRLMNDTRYGSTAGACTPDEARTRSVWSQVHAGTAYWNCCDRLSPRLPLSGVGDSGIGLTMSTYGIQTFTRPKAWHLRKAFTSLGVAGTPNTGARNVTHTPPRTVGVGVRVDF